MAKGSKKGACSAHIQAAKANCLEHARRDYGEKNRPQYILTKRSADNVTVYEHEAIRDRKSIRPLIRQAEKLYTEKTGQKCQKSFAPYREDVLSLPGRGDITKEQLMNYKDQVEAATGWQCMGMWYHKDEGFVKSKHIEGSEGEAINYHVHCLWYCQDPETGKAKRNDRKFFSLRQDWLADATGMERGNKAAETGIKGRTAMEQRIHSQEQRIEQLQTVIDDKEAEKIRAWEEAKKAREAKMVADAAVSAIELSKKRVEAERDQLKKEVEDLKVGKAMKEKALGVFGQSSKDKTIKDQERQIQALQSDLKAERDNHAAELKKALQNAQKPFVAFLSRIASIVGWHPTTITVNNAEEAARRVKDVVNSRDMWMRSSQKAEGELKELKHSMNQEEVRQIKR